MLVWASSHWLLEFELCLQLHLWFHLKRRKSVSFFAKHSFNPDAPPTQTDLRVIYPWFTGEEKDISPLFVPFSSSSRAYDARWEWYGRIAWVLLTFSVKWNSEAKQNVSYLVCVAPHVELKMSGASFGLYFMLAYFYYNTAKSSRLNINQRGCESQTILVFVEVYSKISSFLAAAVQSHFSCTGLSNQHTAAPSNQQHWEDPSIDLYVFSTA